MAEAFVHVPLVTVTPPVDPLLFPIYALLMLRLPPPNSSAPLSPLVSPTITLFEGLLIDPPDVKARVPVLMVVRPV